MFLRAPQKGPGGAESDRELLFIKLIVPRLPFRLCCRQGTMQQQRKGSAMPLGHCAELVCKVWQKNLSIVWTSFSFSECGTAFYVLLPWVQGVSSSHHLLYLNMQPFAPQNVAALPCTQSTTQDSITFPHLFPPMPLMVDNGEIHWDLSSLHFHH